MNDDIKAVARSINKTRGNVEVQGMYEFVLDVVAEHIADELSLDNEGFSRQDFLYKAGYGE